MEDTGESYGFENCRIPVFLLDGCSTFESSRSNCICNRSSAQQRLHERHHSHSGVSSTSSSRPTTPAASSTSSIPVSEDQSYTLSNVPPPPDPEGVTAVLKDKSADDLKRLLSDEEAYRDLLLSLECVKTQNRVRDELRDETMQLARDNLEKEPQVSELRNQCSIIRTTEMASAQEKLHSLEKKQEHTPLQSSSYLVIHQLQEAMNRTDEESEALHGKLLDREVDLTEFIQKYKKMRHTYHKQALTHLAMKTSPTSCA